MFLPFKITPCSFLDEVIIIDIIPKPKPVLHNQRWVYENISSKNVYVKSFLIKPFSFQLTSISFFLFSLPHPTLLLIKVIISQTTYHLTNTIHYLTNTNHYLTNTTHHLTNTTYSVIISQTMYNLTTTMHYLTNTMHYPTNTSHCLTNTTHYD